MKDKNLPVVLRILWVSLCTPAASAWVSQNRIRAETCELNVLSVRGGEEMQAHPRCERRRKQQAETLSLLASRSHLLGLKVIHACHQLHTELSLYGAQRMNSKRVPGESEGQSADSTSKVGRRPRPRNREHERASRGREICASQIIWEGLLSSSSARAAVEQHHRPGGGLKQQKCSVSQIWRLDVQDQGPARLGSVQSSLTGSQAAIVSASLRGLFSVCAWHRGRGLTISLVCLLRSALSPSD